MSKVWKWLFLGLLALNLALVSVVTYRVMTPVETSSVSLPKGATKIGRYSMTKEELDAALTGFAQDYSTDYISIDNKKEKVTLNIQSMKNEKGITARAKSLDLVNDRIEFDIYKTIN